MPEFDWNDLRAFLAVARDGRLTAAARRLKVDHSTLSRRITGLEAALQARLFERHSSGYALTPAGERLVGEAEAMESRAMTIRSRVAEDGSSLEGPVRIGTPEGFGSFFLAQQIEVIATRHPALGIELVANPRAVSLPKREADIVVTGSRPEEGRLHGRKLTDYELGLYASPRYLARVGPIRTRCDLLPCTFIGYIDDLIPTPQHDYLQTLLEGVAPRIRTSDIISQFAMTLSGAGLCILPCFIAASADFCPAPDLKLVRLLHDEIRLHRSYWLVMNSDMREVRRVRASATFIVDAVHAARDTFLPSAAPVTDVAGSGD